MQPPAQHAAKRTWISALWVVLALFAVVLLLLLVHPENQPARGRQLLRRPGRLSVSKGSGFRYAATPVASYGRSGGQD